MNAIYSGKKYDNSVGKRLVSVTGDVFLIIKDGCKLTIRDGIAENEGNNRLKYEFLKRFKG